MTVSTYGEGWPTLSLTGEDIYTALRAFLQVAINPPIPVVLAQDNRVAQPDMADFITMTPISEERIELNTITYTDGYPNTPGYSYHLNPAIVTVQIDVHGPNSGNNAHIIVTLFRSEWGVDQFLAASNGNVVPLHTGEPPRQVPYLNGEQQIEERWVIDCVLQCNGTVTTGQDFAAALKVGLIPVDVYYPPT